MGHDPRRFSSGPVVTLTAALLVAFAVGLVVVVIVTGGNAFAVGLLITVVAAGGTGLILERIDRSRQPDSDRNPEDFWGFRGRPGA